MSSSSHNNTLKKVFRYMVGLTFVAGVVITCNNDRNNGVERAWDRMEFRDLNNSDQGVPPNLLGLPIKGEGLGDSSSIANPPVYEAN